MYCIVENDKKKRGLGILKNVFNSLSTVFCHSLHVQVVPIFPRKMQSYSQSDRKQKNSIHKTKMYLQQMRNKIVGKKKHNQKITQNEKSPFC